MNDEALCEELYSWINGLDLSKPKRNFARDFSDGVAVAEILKKDFPRLVDLHNYIPANALTNKMKNWNWLNKKVLVKIGLGQNHATLKTLASSDKNAIEKLLLAVKKKLDEINEERAKLNFTADDQITEVIRIRSTVAYEDFKMVQEDLARKDEEVQLLQAKVSHLEALIDLKNQRLMDLTGQLNRCVCRKM